MKAILVRQQKGAGPRDSRLKYFLEFVNVTAGGLHMGGGLVALGTLSTGGDRVRRLWDPMQGGLSFSGWRRASSDATSANPPPPPCEDLTLNWALHSPHWGGR